MVSVQYFEQQPKKFECCMKCATKYFYYFQSFDPCRSATRSLFILTSRWRSRSMADPPLGPLNPRGGGQGPRMERCLLGKEVVMLPEALNGQVSQRQCRYVCTCRAPNGARFVCLWGTRTEIHPLQVCPVRGIDPLNWLVRVCLLNYSLKFCTMH